MNMITSSFFHLVVSMLIAEGKNFPGRELVMKLDVIFITNTCVELQFVQSYFPQTSVFERQYAD